jgi:hypothetical protein
MRARRAEDAPAESDVRVIVDGVEQAVQGRVAAMIRCLLAQQAALEPHPRFQLRFDVAGEGVRPSLKVPLASPPRDG